MNRIFLLFSFLAAGCATAVSKSTCESRNWFELGRQSAAQGLPNTKYPELAKSCKDMGVEADPKLYNSGYEDGLKLFCTPGTAVQWGRENKPNPNICQGSQAKEFVRLHAVGDNLRTMDGEKAKLVEANEKLYEKLGDANMPAAERKSLEGKVKRNEAKLRSMTDEIHRLEKRYGLRPI